MMGGVSFTTVAAAALVASQRPPINSLADLVFVACTTELFARSLSGGAGDRPGPPPC